jgi:hypothetical protein
MNGMDAEETIDMVKASPGTAFDSGTQREMTAEEIQAAKRAEEAAAQPSAEQIAAARAAEDQAIADKAAAEEASLKAEAEAMRAEDALGVEETPPIVFDASETGHDLAGLIDMIKNGATLIFGGAGLSLPAVPAQPTRAADWTVTGGRLEFSGEFSILMPNEGVPVQADAVALADGPDGPIRSVAPLGGAVLFSPGGEYKFASGAFVFEGVQL